MATHQVIPPGREALAFFCETPADFNPIEIPSDPVDFDVPTTFLPLFAAVASYGAVIFTVAEIGRAHV